MPRTTTREETNGDGEAALDELTTKAGGKSEQVALRPIVKRVVTLTLIGQTPLLQDNGTPAQEMIEKGKRGPAERGRRAYVDDAAIEAKWKAARYLTPDGRPAVPARAVALAIASGASAAFKTATKSKERSDFVFRALTVLDTVRGDDGVDLVPVEGVTAADFRMLRTLGRNANAGKKSGEGTTDVRYRAELPETWRIPVRIRFRADMLTVAELIEAAISAGESIGLLAWRKEKGGTHGMFTVEAGTVQNAPSA